MKVNRKLKQGITLLLSALMVMAALSGCGTKSDGGGKTGDNAVTDSTKPVKIRWFQDLRGVDPKKDRIIQKIQEINNVEFDFIASPGGSEEQDQKLNLMISTGEKLDLVTMLSGVDALALQWVNDDILLPFDDYVAADKNPEMNAIINADIYKWLKVDGKSYFQPLPLEAGNRGYVIRKDWLDKLNLKIPTNLDEYYEVIKAFATQDPDGNGKNDSYGFFVSEPYGSNSFGYIARSFVNCGCWGGDWVELSDGTVTQFVTSPYAKDAFKFIKKCYDEGLFNKSFVNEKDAEGKVDDLMVQGKVGMMDVTGVTSLLRRFQDAGITPDLAYLPPLNTADGKKGTLPHSGGSWGTHVIPKTSENPQRVVDFLNWSLTEEGRELTMFGMKDVHYTNKTVENEMTIYTLNKEEMAKDWNVGDYGYSHPLAWGGFNYSGGYIPLKENDFDFDKAYPLQEVWKSTDDVGTIFDGIKGMNAEYAQIFPFQATIDPTVIVDQKLIDIEIQGRTKAIVEPADKFDANWQAMLDSWMASGGKELLEAGNAAWEKLK